MSQIDARLLELEFLSRLDRETAGGRPFVVQRDLQRQREEYATVQMISSLLYDGYLNDYFERVRNIESGQHGVLPYTLADWRNADLETYIRGGSVNLWFGHKGRVRLSELQQQLRTGRDRDPTGLLLDQRHVDMGIAVSILSARVDAPLTLAFLDMNDLRNLNNSHGHQAGDDAIRAFFHAILQVFGRVGEAFRNGGDEVIVLIPGASDAKASTLLDAFVRQLGKDELEVGEGKVRIRLTASCGSVSTADPNFSPKDLRELADKAQYRAKEASGERDEEGHWKRTVPRMSAYLVGNTGRPVVYDPRMLESAKQ